MANLRDLKIGVIKNQAAKALVKHHHYMHTWPAGALFSFGVHTGDPTNPLGVAVFGRSSGTVGQLKRFNLPPVPETIIEMQRFWLSDALGHNAESTVLSKIIKLIKANAPQIKVVWTYAGGCKNDCGIVYQSSGFMYLGCVECNDFYLTEAGEYKNIVNVLRFGKAPKELKTHEEKARYVYGPGKLLKTKRYYYFYPIDKGLRRRMRGQCEAFPKDSEHFRRNQQWVG